MRRQTRRLTVMLLFLALAGGAWAGKARSPRVEIIGASQVTIELVDLDIRVTDPESRPVDLMLEARVKGTKGWFAVTPVEGANALLDVPATPTGTLLALSWNVYDAIGSAYDKKARFRATPLNPSGRRGKSGKVLLATYGQIGADTLAAQILDDLDVSGGPDGYLLVDTRPVERFGRGTVPGAVSIPFGEKSKAKKRALGKAKETRIVFFCEGVG